VGVAARQVGVVVGRGRGEDVGVSERDL